MLAYTGKVWRTKVPARAGYEQVLIRNNVGHTVEKSAVVTHGGLLQKPTSRAISSFLDAKGS